MRGPRPQPEIRQQPQRGEQSRAQGQPSLVGGRHQLPGIKLESAESPSQAEQQQPGSPNHRFIGNCGGSLLRHWYRTRPEM